MFNYSKNWWHGYNAAVLPITQCKLTTFQFVCCVYLLHPLSLESHKLMLIVTLKFGWGLCALLAMMPDIPILPFKMPSSLAMAINLMMGSINVFVSMLRSLSWLTTTWCGFCKITTLTSIVVLFAWGNRYLKRQEGCQTRPSTGNRKGKEVDCTGHLAIYSLAVGTTLAPLLLGLLLQQHQQQCSGDDGRFSSHLLLGCPRYACTSESHWVVVRMTRARGRRTVLPVIQPSTPDVSNLERYPTIVLLARLTKVRC